MSLTELAKTALQSEAYAQALDYLHRALVYPDNLGEGKLQGARENDIYYWMGCVLQKMDRKDEAEVCWREAAKGSGEPAAAIFYNDQQPDKILYQGLALLKLGKDDEAHSYFIKLAEYGAAHLNDVVKIDYFAVSLPDLLIWEDDLSRRNRMHCIYIKALGLLGLSRKDEAGGLLTKVLDIDKSHSGAKVHFRQL
jgi:tetratricopeptide (TPR) repeat protein